VDDEISLLIDEPLRDRIIITPKKLMFFREMSVRNLYDPHLMSRI
jgi:hypothetical protein